jgi:hypothetical protein
MAKKPRKRRAWTAAEVRELKTLARKKTPAAGTAKKLTLRTRAGRYVITSPAKTSNSVSTWSKAFNDT